jgi:hypothetical protein
VPTTNFDVVQDGGDAVVQITGRPIVSQDLEQFNVISTYEGPQPDAIVGLDDFTVQQRNPDTGSFPMQFVVPMDDLRLYYARTGLPVTLDYEGSVLLTGEFFVGNPITLPVVVITPEPTGVVLLGLFCMAGVFKRPR